MIKSNNDWQLWRFAPLLLAVRNQSQSLSRKRSRGAAHVAANGTAMRTSVREAGPIAARCGAP
jgi:hypothetical protein